MHNVPESVVGPGHQDFELLSRIRTAISERVGGIEELRQQFPMLIREAIDFVLDPQRTGRTRFEHLDKVEKTFIGLKVEHHVRDFLDVPSGIRDLQIGGIDVDIKNTIGNGWMIPPETYLNGDPCLVIASDEQSNLCWLGLIVARQEYLGEKNRDGKRGVRRPAFKNILWLLREEPYPQSRWQNIDMRRFRELRNIKGGTKRAVEFFRMNLRVPIHRQIVQALLFDQQDYMKRVRGNGGARDVLRREDIAILSGNYDGELIKELGLPNTMNDEFIGISPRNSAERSLLEKANLIDSNT